MTPGTYRLVTDDVEAMQVDCYDYDGLCDIIGWINGRAVDEEEALDDIRRSMLPKPHLPVIQFENERFELQYLYDGDWVVKQRNGKVSRWPNGSFQGRYEPILGDVV